LKRLWGFAKVRYRGLAKNANRAFAMLAMALNILKWGRPLTATGASDMSRMPGTRERERGHFLYWRGFSVGWLWLATPVAGATQRKNLRVAMRWVDPGLERSSPAIAFR
jgi:hypothetical protein